jgi:hypothetical protein
LWVLLAWWLAFSSNLFRYIDHIRWWFISFLIKYSLSWRVCNSSIIQSQTILNLTKLRQKVSIFVIPKTVIGFVTKYIF